MTRLRQLHVAWPLAIGVLSIVARLPLLGLSGQRGISSDTGTYLRITESLLAGDGFANEAQRTAGYPLMLLGLHPLPGPTVDAAVLVQHGLGAALVMAIVVAGMRWFGTMTGVAAGAMAALSPALPAAEHAVLPDLLFGIMTFAVAWVLAEAAQHRRPPTRVLVAAGALIGAAANVKPSGQVLLVAVPIALLGGTRAWRPLVRSTLIAWGVAAALMAPWFIHNWISYGEPTMSIQGNEGLFLRVFDQDRLPFPDTPDGRLAERVRSARAHLYPPGEVSDTYTFFARAVVADGRSRQEAGHVEGRLARQAILDHPWTYAKGTWRNVRQYVTYSHDFASARVVANTQLDVADPPPGVRAAHAAWSVADRLARWWWVLALQGFALLLPLVAGPLRGRRAALALWAVWAPVAVGSSMASLVEARYAVQIAPELWLLAAAGGFMLLRLIRDAIASRAP